MAKKFYLSSRERKIAGVCGGIAEYFDLDVVFVRAAFLGLLFLSGWGLLVYIIFWLLAPRSPS